MKQLLHLPEQEHISCNGEVSLAVDDDDTVLCEGKVSVAFPAVFVSRLFRIILSNSYDCIILSKSNMKTDPVIVMLRDDNGVDIIASPAVPEDNPVLVSSTEEVSIQVHRQIARLLLQFQGWVVHLQTVHQVSFAAVAVYFATLGEMSEYNDEVPTAAGAEVGPISVQLLQLCVKLILINQKNI